MPETNQYYSTVVAAKWGTRWPIWPGCLLGLLAE
jgi:hypothetical protein